MRIKAAIERVPGGLMIVPLLLGALVNTIDQAHWGPIQAALKGLGATPMPVKGAEAGTVVYEFLRIGSFTEALFKTGALTLIALFLFCAGSQMNVRVGGRAIVKGSILLLTKFGVGVGFGFLLSAAFGPMNGLLGLTAMTVIAAMTNGNGGMYAALTGQYGNRSDVGALSVLSLNDGPFLTMVALGLLGEQFPLIAFISVLLPIVLGMVLGNLDEEMRTFLAPGERLLIPFFAFALGAGMNLANFLNPAAVGGGLLLGVATTLVTGSAMWIAFALFRYRSRVAAFSEASVAGNAMGTPAAVAAAAGAAASAAAAAGSPLAAELAQRAAQYQEAVKLANAQISIAVITTALLCPVAVMLLDRWQRDRGIDGTVEPDPAGV